MLHRMWLRFSEIRLAKEELHHHDVVHFALEEVQKEMEEGHEEEVILRLKAHLDSNQKSKAQR